MIRVGVRCLNSCEDQHFSLSAKPMHSANRDDVGPCGFCLSVLWLGELGLYLPKYKYISAARSLCRKANAIFMIWILTEKWRKQSVLVLMRKFPFVNYFSQCLPVPAAPLLSCTEKDTDSLYYLLSAASALLICIADCSLTHLSWRPQLLVKARATLLST